MWTVLAEVGRSRGNVNFAAVSMGEYTCELEQYSYSIQSLTYYHRTGGKNISIHQSRFSSINKDIAMDP